MNPNKIRIINLFKQILVGKKKKKIQQNAALSQVKTTSKISSIDIEFKIVHGSI